MSLIEALAALFGVVNIALIIRRSVWNFPVALVMVTLTGVVLWQARLYSDAGLQAFFFAVNIIGWVLWARNRNAQCLWLEVRVSNARAMQVYERYGYRRVGERKNYYPADHGQREHAVVMSMTL